jgi:glycosyltransferase involved in cell wall biosynthesis
MYMSDQKMVAPLKKKIAVLHAFLKSDCKGGGERLIFEIRNYYKADLFVGAIGLDVWGKQNALSDSFVKEVWRPEFKFTYLHEDAKNSIWMRLKRQLAFLFSPKINQLKDYDLVFFSGNIGFVPARLKGSKAKKVLYCHTPPRPFTDQFESLLNSKPAWLRPLVKIFARWVIWQYRKDCEQMDLIVTNSQNTHDRLLKYVGLESKIIFPAVDTKRFQYIGQKDYYLSYARVEPLKRIPLILEAFAKMPDKKLIIASGGPLAGWVKEQIATRNLTNITYEGLVTDERLSDLVGNCIGGIMIPINEDAGMTQCEIMAAGKPVVGVDEGGLKETVIDGKTGIMIKANPEVEDLMEAVQKLTPEMALKMKDDCIKQASKFDSSVFFQKMDGLLEELEK